MDFPELIGGARLIPLDASAAAELDALQLRCADFTRLIEGREPEPHEGRDILTETPPNLPNADKVVLGARSGDALIGVVDLLRGYPTPEVWWIGLLMLAPEARGGGLGAGILRALTDWAAGEGATSLQLGVQSQNEGGLRFWRRHGFEHIRTAEQQNGRLHNQVLVLKRRLA